MVTRKILMLACCAAASFSYSVVADDQQPLYDYLNEIILKSVPAQQAKVPDRKIGLPFSAQPARMRPEDVAIKAIKETEQKLLFLRLLQSEHPNKVLGGVLDTAAIESLDLVGRGEQFAALSRTFGTKTPFGDVMLAALLTNPLSDAGSITRRQNLLRHLQEKRSAVDDINQGLKEIRDGQALFFTFFDEANKFDDRLLQRVYGPFGKSVPAIVLFRMLDRAGLISNLVSPIIAYNNIADIKNLVDKIGAGQKISSQEVVLKMTGVNAVLGIPRTLFDWHNPRALFCDAGSTFGQKAGTIALRCGRTMAVDAIMAWMLYFAVQEDRVSSAIFANMQTRLIGVAHVVRGLQRINMVMGKNPELLVQMPELKPLADLFDKKRDAALKKLLALLQTRTFQKEPAYFSNGIRILHAYRLMYERGHDFVPALEAVGLLDNFVAAAELMVHGAPGAYCYVTLSDSSLPVIKLKKFWSPLLDYAKAKVNDVELGIGGDANMMLTGPNGSGKSTNMKAIVLNVALAQTFGIAAAQEAEITPFQKIYTYLNVQENIQQSLSTFMAEARRLKQIEDSITKLPTGTRCLSIIDEGMTGTVASEGVARLCDVCCNICLVPGSTCILATHFEEPTKLEAETSGRWVNYHVEIAEPTPGNFVRLFTLKRGLNDWWFNDHQKRKRFIDWLVQLRAMKIT